MLPAGVRVLVCTTPQDMRKSFDTLGAVVREALHEEPQSGSLYVFVGKRPTRIKILWWDRNGFCLLSKRLHRALFQLPERSAGDDRVEQGVQIDGTALGVLLAGVERENKRRRALH